MDFFDLEKLAVLFFPKRCLFCELEVGCFVFSEKKLAVLFFPTDI